MHEVSLGVGGLYLAYLSWHFFMRRVWFVSFPVPDPFDLIMPNLLAEKEHTAVDIIFYYKSCLTLKIKIKSAKTQKCS